MPVRLGLRILQIVQTDKLTSFNNPDPESNTIEAVANGAHAPVPDAQHGHRHRGERRCAEDQICTRVPSSTTQLCGSLKKSATLPALRDIVANSDSRQ
jgi:hypothetical protein